MNIDADKRQWLVLILLIAGFSLGVRLLSHYHFETTALLYVGMPMGIAVTLILFTGDSASVNWKLRYWNHLRAATIVMLGSSVILFEGFLCVLMFLPIYFTVVLFIFLVECIYRALKKDNKATLPVHILPLLLLASSMEGTLPQLSFPRFNEVSYSKVVDADIQQIKLNLQKPINLGEDMPAFLSLFPMPYAVEAETLKAGDIHRSYFRYHRWFVTNTHEGYMDIKLVEVGDRHIRTEVVADTSYLSNYLTLHGTLIELEPLADNKTRVTLKVSYKRKLDPAWYFGPLERFAVKQTAGYLIDKVIARKEQDQNG
ncbi:MAG: hypothetical protein HRU20_06355 [Pseudomonadales bacterium]|nr:hypothetical protein [Pseudomonadales bacterium]